MKRLTYSATVIFLLITTVVSLSQSGLQKNAIYYNEKGWEFLGKSDYFKAVLAFRNALKQNPKYKEAIMGLAKTYLRTEAYDESLKLFADVLVIDKNNIQAIVDSALAFGKLGKFSKALEYMEKAFKIDEDNIDAKYNTAYIYYLMNKSIESRRLLNDIFKINPYHYESLLLASDIKVSENREKEALEYIRKAIDSDQEKPEAYIKYGLIMLKRYRNTQDQDDMVDAVEKFNRALAINPENLMANRSLGQLFLIRKEYVKALDYFKKNNENYPDNAFSIYNTASAYAGLGDKNNTINFMLKTLEKAPSDSLLIAKLEDYLTLNDFAEGHPLRVKFSEDHFQSAEQKMKKNLADDALLHLNRSLFLNPQNREARETLRDMYLIHNYYRLYLDEEKTLLELYPGKKYGDRLHLDIINRRERLYYKAGYSQEIPVRDVPGILVLDFSPIEPASLHPDCGELIGNYLTFALSQLGRMQCFGIQDRLAFSRQLINDNQFIGDNLEKLSHILRETHTEKPDFIVFGTYMEGINHLSIEMELMDFRNGVIISEFALSESGKDNLPDLSISAAKKIYDVIPFNGRILKIDNNQIITNLGLIDGVKKGDLVYIFKIDSSENERANLKKKITFEITDADTYVSSAKNKIDKEISLIDINDTVYPYKKRRAKLIE